MIDTVYFRIGRGRDPVVYRGDTVFEFGKAIVHEVGEDLTIIACGMAVHGAIGGRDGAARSRSFGWCD